MPRSRSLSTTARQVNLRDRRTRVGLPSLHPQRALPVSADLVPSVMRLSRFRVANCSAWANLAAMRLLSVSTGWPYCSRADRIALSSFAWALSR